MQCITDMTVAILAGGLGTRLRPFVEDRPKVLAEVRGRPFLSYLLDQVVAVGIKNVVLCTGYLSDQVQAAFGDPYRNLKLVFSQEQEPLGTAGALGLAKPLLRSDPVMVMNGDSYCQADLGAFLAWHQEQGAEATMLLTEVPDTQRFGWVHVSEARRILRFEEKGANQGRGSINAGIYIINQRLLQTLSSNGTSSLEKDIFPTWVDHEFFGYESDGRFLDIGTPEAYAGAEAFFGGDVRL